MRAWPVLLPLLVVVLLPTAGVLWFMTRAMGNEQLAVRQKLEEIYLAQLHDLRTGLEAQWQERAAALEAGATTAEGGEGESAAERFARLVRAGKVDSVVILDREGRPAYPAPTLQPTFEEPSFGREGLRAERLEFSGRSREAAEAYARIAAAAVADDPDSAALALLAEARCRVAAGQRDLAIEILGRSLASPTYASAVDGQGRLIAPNAQLRALQLLTAQAENPEDRAELPGTDPRYQRIFAAFEARLGQYDGAPLAAAQRRFLMNELLRLSDRPESAANSDALAFDPLAVVAPVSEGPRFDTLAAEELAARYLESLPATPPSTTALLPSGLEGIRHLAAADGSAIALFEEKGLRAEIEREIGQRNLASGTVTRLLAPGEKAEASYLVSLPAGGFFRDWQWVLRPEDQTLFTAAAKERIRAYWLTAGLVIAGIVVLTLMVARRIRRQLRLTRLENDLLATVSHELKTPLASMRLLVETLLEAGSHDPERVREYLQLISKENTRLSRLVDNFLTFSRMEQDQQTFDKKAITAASVMEAAVDSVSERFSAPGCQLEVRIAPELPELMADPDAMVMVLLNLLDNAYKYSEEPKEISASAWAENGRVCFAVSDNGLGLSSQQAARIFDRFYQVDQSLSRPGSGCGLGLSIVDRIVRAHQGTIEVDSRPGEGSTFTVRLPARSRPTAVPPAVISQEVA